MYIRTNGAGQSLVCIIVNGKKLPHEAELVSLLRQAVPDAVGVVLGVNAQPTGAVLGREYRTLWGENVLTDHLCGLTFRLSVPSFFQVNRPMAEVLYETALDFAGLTGRELVLDLYCGAGTISQVMARRAARVIGAEIVPEAIADARENARRYGVTGIDFRLCDGLSAIRAEECDAVVIAGMGGENIAAILAAAPWTADGRHTLVLQPQSRPEVLRRFLMEHGYAITREALVEDRGHLYPVLEAGAGEMKLTPGQLHCGVKLLRDPLWDRYLIDKIIQLQNVVVGCRRSADPADRARAEEQRDLITELLAMREEWRHANGTRN